MDFCYSKAFGVSSANGYERLLLDAMLGDGTLFRASRRRGGDLGADDADSGVLGEESGEGFPQLCRGTWGPSTGDALMELDGRKWRKL